MARYNDAGDLRAWDVMVSIQVTNQTSGGEEADELFERQRRGLWGPPRDDNFNFHNFKTSNREDAGWRRLEASVEVNYDQIPTDKTAAPGLYDTRYVATDPFEGANGSERYTAALRGLLTHYARVNDAGRTPADPPPAGPSLSGRPPTPAPPDGSSENVSAKEPEEDGGSPVGAVVGALCVLLFVAAAALLLVRRRRAKRRSDGASTEEARSATGIDRTAGAARASRAFVARGGARGGPPGLRRPTSPRPPPRSLRRRAFGQWGVGRIKILTLSKNYRTRYLS